MLLIGSICIDNIISSFQTGFILRQNIQENIIVAQEMLHSMNHLNGKISDFMLKVGLAKAYDNLN